MKVGRTYYSIHNSVHKKVGRTIGVSSIHTYYSIHNSVHKKVDKSILVVYGPYK